MRQPYGLSVLPRAPRRAAAPTCVIPRRAIAVEFPRALSGCSRRGQKATRSTTEVAQVHAPRFGRGCQARGQVQCLLELGPWDGGLLAHVAKNGDFGPR